MAETVASDRTASEPSYPLAPSIHAMAAEETPMATFMEKLDELNTMPSDRTPLRHSPYSTTSPLMALSAAFIGMMPTMRTMMETKNTHRLLGSTNTSRLPTATSTRPAIEALRLPNRATSGPANGRPMTMGITVARPITAIRLELPSTYLAM